ncbi:MAG: prepilin-type N-terminal cleavage/methylation domain-containing protein [Oscillospiraceae bacterium]|nr:prepilin-type N-terminal cleavage/methylation domain-containing protein [Oscillospiraceae bacterium]
MKILKNLLNRLKENEKGFTLIEIVIVIVIIAILATMLVPSMLSWIDSANQRTFLSGADSIKTSVTTQITNKYAKNETVSTQANFTAADWTTVSDLVGETVAAASGEGVDYVVTFSCTGNKLTSMTVANTKYTVTYSAGTWGDVTPVGS